MQEKKEVVRIVYLDRGSIPERFIVSRPTIAHEWEDYSKSRPDQVIERSLGANVLVSNKVLITEDILLACPGVQHVAVSATGYNIVDLDACRRLGVSVSNIPSYAANTVAEHTITSALCLRRSLNSYRNKVISGEWQLSDTFCLFAKPLSDIKGATFGVIGFGELGQATASMAHALGMNVIFSSKSKHQSEVAKQVSFDELIQQSDIISLHCSLNQNTKNLIDLTQLKRMKPHCILINTARGGIVNEVDVVSAVEQELIGGIAFDVLIEEPPKGDSPILSIANRDNVILTPHIAWASEQAMQSLVNILAANIEGFLIGKPQNIVS
jgi:glycerate dehydrogenase